jgi:hypothetical protein
MIKPARTKSKKKSITKRRSPSEEEKIVRSLEAIIDDTDLLKHDLEQSMIESKIDDPVVQDLETRLRNLNDKKASDKNIIPSLESRMALLKKDVVFREQVDDVNLLSYKMDKSFEMIENIFKESTESKSEVKEIKEILGTFKKGVVAFKKDLKSYQKGVNNQLKTLENSVTLNATKQEEMMAMMTTMLQMQQRQESREMTKAQAAEQSQLREIFKSGVRGIAKMAFGAPIKLMEIVVFKPAFYAFWRGFGQYAYYAWGIFMLFCIFLGVLTTYIFMNKYCPNVLGFFVQAIVLCYRAIWYVGDKIQYAFFGVFVKDAIDISQAYSEGQIIEAQNQASATYHEMTESLSKLFWDAVTPKYSIWDGKINRFKSSRGKTLKIKSKPARKMKSKKKSKASRKMKSKKNKIKLI